MVKDILESIQNTYKYQKVRQGIYQGIFDMSTYNWKDLKAFLLLRVNIEVNHHPKNPNGMKLQSSWQFPALHPTTPGTFVLLQELHK